MKASWLKRYSEFHIALQHSKFCLECRIQIAGDKRLGRKLFLDLSEGVKGFSRDVVEVSETRCVFRHRDTESLDFIKGFLQESKVFICKLSAYGHENLVEVIAGASSGNVIAVAGVLKGFG